ncbi:hypothetical protein [Bradyrhizobium japonicum]|uniref:hypothetical protein n=1 Tax=Bradyrhizobium japonicum TaxID=375 RepID=UPI001B89F2F9|nr:hypothetical protein [Bradyrhizobium japonicum]MBR0971878.1 hypothetical protein [Bradyrhizobium japonicum]
MTATVVVMAVFCAAMYGLFNKYVNHTRALCDLMIWTLLDEHVHRARRDDMLDEIQKLQANSPSELRNKVQDHLIETAQRFSGKEPPYTAEHQLWKKRKQTR